MKENASKNKVWKKICYIDGIIKNRFNGYSIIRQLADLVHTKRSDNWTEDEIYELLDKHVELDAKTVVYLNSIKGYLYGYSS